ncbi:hypothetical protein SPRG_15141 [Saprolegnia parasitica CBS 223.65]|uniref:Uncharacterized protein n=1 Tax=Saprolegnia parasitica (strain CBS 223.65) TaxID=695850 RepID=A0A067BRH0_SAPPC|nr:hypothetical protein SPRG_15141 [Saprolegnia parasitica CBS 223.65]KDO19400.1 hypothetical protein SPRG_15141 [Saprolegnia parasitica CBS 223.65]|eukprot:XP_012209904.1 hypothetical protein SPRG_15141 [Saprolegnia parasitica CBS 223.65]
MDVKETKWLLASWVSRQIVLTAQALQVFDGDKLQWACKPTACTTRILDALDTTRRFPLELCEHGKTGVLINAPTASARDELLEYLYAASNSVAWPSRVDHWTRFLSVARRINESHPIGPTVPKCNVSIGLVQRHLEDMVDVYNVSGAFTDMVDVYSYFLEQERLYVAGGAINFAHTVHRLHPVDLFASKKQPPSTLTPLVDIVSTCAHCKAPLPPAVSFQMHIAMQPVTCPACDCPLLYETYKILGFLAAYPGVLARFPGVTASRYGARLHTYPGVPRDGRFATFFAALLDMVLGCEHTLELGAPSLRTSLRKLADTIGQEAIGAYTIDLVQGMFRQLDFINKMVPHAEYWRHPQVLAAAIVRYEQFMYLLGRRTRNERGHFLTTLVPTVDIALVWHAHQTTERAYRNYCRSLTKPKCILDDDDATRCDDVAKRYADTYVLWSHTFRTPYSSCPPSWEAWIGTKDPVSRLVLRKKWTTYGALPSKDNRFFGVHESFTVDALSYAHGVAQANATHALDPMPVYVTVIGTPVFDARVRMPFSHQTLLMFDGGLPYYHLPHAGANVGYGYFGQLQGGGAVVHDAGTASFGYL